MKYFTVVLVLIEIQCYLCIPLTQTTIKGKSTDKNDARIKQTRRFYSTKEEIELTKVEPRIDVEPCNSIQLLSVFILSTGSSHGKYFDKRQSQRKTWVPELRQHNVSIYFALALSPNETVNEELKEESEKYLDIIQFSFIDGYYNLTLKTISILRWIHKKCLTSTYILKVDDDVVINSELLLQKLSEFKTGITGKVTSDDVPNRDPNNFAAYTPFECFPNDTLPDYLYGPAYMMAGNISHTLLKAVDDLPYCVIQIEDVFLTGIVAELARIPRYWSPLIRHIGCEWVCPLYDTPVIYPCKDGQQTEEFWSWWKNTSYEYCQFVYYSKMVMEQLPSLFLVFCTLSLLCLCLFIRKRSKKIRKRR